jgi:hypothetical protein
MPGIKISGKAVSSKAKSSPARKAKASTTRTKTTAKKTTGRKVTQAAKPAASSNGNGRSPRMPDGMTKAEFNQIVKAMDRAASNRDALKEKYETAVSDVHEVALEALSNDVPMALVSTTLGLSRQWLYTLMEKHGVLTARQSAGRKPTRKANAAKPAAKKTATRKPAGRTTRSKTTTRRSSASKSSTRSRGGIKLSGRR